MRHHLGCALGHLGQQRHIGVGAFLRAMVAGGVKMLYHIVRQRFELRVLLAMRKMLEMAKAHKALRHPGDYRRSFALFAPDGGV